VTRLARILQGLERPNNRGRPLTPVQQVCVALGFYGGGHLTRVAGLCGGVSQKAAWCAVRRVTTALVALKGQVIRMPDDLECAATVQRLKDRFHLEGFAFGVDGVLVKFEEAPRSIPAGTVKQDFWCRKMHYAINCQIVGNDRGLILDINADWQGANNDARIWATSPIKEVINRQRRFLVAGDSAYPISDICITPYRVAEAANDPTKRLFNRRQ
jgi:DDE superfamily endonuclease